MSEHLNLGVGIHENISEADYHADRLCEIPTLSCSLAKTLIGQAPIHAWSQHPRLGNKAKREVTSEMDYGSACHKLLLGKGADIAVCEEDTWQKNVAKEFKREARANGQIPILVHKYALAIELHYAFTRQMREFGLLDAFFLAKSEVVMLYDDGSVRCRAMLDKLHIDEGSAKGMIFDVKTTDSANPNGIGRLVFNQDYDMQQASYTNGLTSQSIRPDLAGRTDFIFLFIEADYPFCLTPARLSGEERTNGQSKWSRAWQMWDACTKANKWPGYVRQIYESEAPGFALAAEMGAKPILP